MLSLIILSARALIYYIFSKLFVNDMKICIFGSSFQYNYFSMHNQWLPFNLIGSIWSGWKTNSLLLMEVYVYARKMVWIWAVSRKSMFFICLWISWYPSFFVIPFQIVLYSYLIVMIAASSRSTFFLRSFALSKSIEKKYRYHELYSHEASEHLRLYVSSLHLGKSFSFKSSF